MPQNLDHPSSPSSSPIFDRSARFSRMAILAGTDGLAVLGQSHVMVIGMGGVGSWAAESLARSGVGQITLVDFDLVCMRNFNRQLGAIESTLGTPKALAMAQRLQAINPHAQITPVVNFAAPETFPTLFNPRPDFVIDAIDHVTTKCALIHHCWEHKIPLVVATGSAGRWDPTLVRTADLAQTQQDPLAKVVRRVLRQKYSFPPKGDFGIPAVYALGPAEMPREAEAPCTFSGCPQATHHLQSCTQQRTVRGSASFVTGAFGLACAAVAVQYLLGRSNLAAREQDEGPN